MRNIMRLVLTLTVATGALLAPIAHADTYSVYVQTGTFDPNNPRKEGNLGTDAHVEMAMHGTEGDAEPMSLSTGSPTDFDAGNLAVFTFEAPHLDSLKRIRIGHDDTGRNPGWFLEWVVIRNETTGKAFYFPYHSWLGRKGLLANERSYVNLTPSDQPDPKSR